MTVVIGDLVTRFRADTSDLQRGGQAARQELKSTEQQAQQTGRALEIMAEQFAKLHGGTAQQALAMFQRTGAQPTGAAMSEAGRQVEATAAAADRASRVRIVETTRAEQERFLRAREVTKETENTAKAAESVSGGWKVSESSVVRFGAALVGVNLGFSLAAGAARQIHDEILGSVDAARQLETSTRAASASYGPGVAGAIGRGAQSFSADPTTRGTQTEYVQAVAGMHGLTTEYGLNLSQVQELVTAAGQLARVQGVDLPTAARALEDVMHGNTSAAQSLGISLTDTTGRLRGVGASYDELVTISGRTRAEQVLLATTLSSVKTQQDNARGSVDNLAAAYDRLAKNADLARQKAGQQLAGPAAAVVNAGADLLNPPGFTPDEVAQRRAGIAGYLSGGRGQLESGEILSAEDTQRRLQSLKAQDAELAARMLSEERAELVQSTSATQQNTAAVQAQLTTYEQMRIAVNRAVESIGRIRSEQSQYSTLLEAAHGPMFPQILGNPRTIGTLSAAQDELALRAQGFAQSQSDTMRAHLEQGVNVAQEVGPNAVARAQQQLDQYDRRVEARTQQAKAQHDLSLLDLGLAENQSRLTEISLGQRARELDMQQRTVGLRREDLQLQRTVLSATQGVTSARLAALPAENAMSAIGYQSQLAQAQAGQLQARLIRGQDVSDLPSFDQLIRSNIDAQFAQAENAPAALAAQRQVDLAGQRQTEAQLREQQTAGQLQGAQLDTDLANLNDLPRQTELLQAQAQLQQQQVDAQREERDAILKLVDIASEAPAAGAGVTNNITVTVNAGSDDTEAIVTDSLAAFEERLRQALAMGRTAGAPADRALAAARR